MHYDLRKRLFRFGLGDQTLITLVLVVCQVASACFDMDGDPLCDEDLIQATDQCLAMAVVPSEELCDLDSFDDITDSQLLDACDFDPCDTKDFEPT